MTTSSRNLSYIYTYISDEFDGSSNGNGLCHLCLWCMLDARAQSNKMIKTARAEVIIANERRAEEKVWLMYQSTSLCFCPSVSPLLLLRLSFSVSVYRFIHLYYIKCMGIAVVTVSLHDDDRRRQTSSR